MASNVVENCDDLHIDAVPDKPREHVREKISPMSEKEEMSSKRRPQEANTIPKAMPKVMKSPHESTSSHRRTGTSASKTHKAPQQPPAVSYVTYNISNTKDIQIGNKYTFNMGSKDTVLKPHSSPAKETPEIKKLLKSNEPITLDDINLVSTHVGLAWKEIGRYLKYSGGQLQQFDADHGREGMKEVVYQLLLDWKQANTSEATVGILCSALWTSNQYDALTEWAKVRS